MWPRCRGTSCFMARASGSCSIRARSAPVMQAAIATVMPDAVEAVTVPASAPVRRAIATDALRCRSPISTNCGSTRAIASIASGTTIEAPRKVIVPETLMTLRRPSSRRMSSFLALMVLPKRMGGIEPRQERAQPLVALVHEHLPGRARHQDLAAVDERHPIAQLAREAHLVGHHQHGHAVPGKVLHHRQHLADQLRVQC